MEEEKKDNIAAEQKSVENAKETKEEVSAASETAVSETETGSSKKKSKPVNKKFLAILIIIVIAVVAYSGYKNGKFDKMLGIEPKMTVAEAEKLINENIISEGYTATVTELTEDKVHNLWKLKLNVGDQEVTAYMTKDRSIFLANPIVIAEVQQQKAAAAEQAKTEQATALASLTKTDKPTVELFVMSHCPYGTQAEKGIIPAVEALGDKIDFQLKFCDYSMHDEKELKEEMNQYCIMQNQGDKLISYLKCFLADGDGTKCLAQTGIDTASLNSCVAATDSKYKIMANYADKTTWRNGQYPTFPIYQADVDKYQVSGSPTLVVNGKQVSSSRDSASYLKTICAGFTTAPAECNQNTLSSTPQSSGFGYAEGSDSTASCG